MKNAGGWLIVGGDGLIGRYLEIHAKPLVDHVIVSSRQRPLRPGRVFADLAVSGDASVLTTVAPEVAFLCAGMTGMQACQDNPNRSREINVTGIVRLASELIRKGCFVIFLSSNAVFDGNTVRPDEDSPYCPSNEYGRQKMIAEQELIALPASAEGVAIVRLSKVMTSTSGVTLEFTKRFLTGEYCFAFEDLRMSPVSLSYVADVLFKIARAKRPGIFHLSGVEEMSYADFARRLASSLGVNPALVKPLSSADAGVKVLFCPNHPALGMKRTIELLGIGPEPTSHLLEQVATRNP